MQVMLPADLDRLLQQLAAEGYRLVGPHATGDGVQLGEIDGVADLPLGWRASVEPASVRWRQEAGAGFFGYFSLLDGWKQFVFPSSERLWSLGEDGPEPVLHDGKPLAMIGMRACDIAGLQVLDRTFMGEDNVDAHYLARRKDAFLIAVECAEAASTCFCAGMQSGPDVKQGADIVLFEIFDAAGHRFLARADSRRGREMLAALALAAASHDDERHAADTLAAVARDAAWEAAADVPQQAEPAHYSEAHWQKVADRCLSCTNCTMVCPTCFCFDSTPVGGVASGAAGAERRWSSCFDCQHSYIHGGVVRDSISSRYRQWLMHKLVTWNEQFGSSGCVGCGRCISACPAAIDIRREAEQLFAKPHEEGSHGES
jgi:ferredoxin